MLYYNRERSEQGSRERVGKKQVILGFMVSITAGTKEKRSGFRAFKHMRSGRRRSGSTRKDVRGEAGRRVIIE